MKHYDDFDPFENPDFVPHLGKLYLDHLLDWANIDIYDPQLDEELESITSGNKSLKDSIKAIELGTSNLSFEEIERMIPIVTEVIDLNDEIIDMLQKAIAMRQIL